ncbi:PspC domain-containing protein [Ornithinimicrobium avium]|uniref:PspC domain-containing protein n=1 Tax=Ornithinimicrobium avium TaxID=2283195 RepID=A0A345NMI7_9MICO|nr:PspC domain-containing protein [Ornithinimicrobium avium]AXH96245.1 PspC domain-containing protein [Ornithinimicrobium avium]
MNEIQHDTTRPPTAVPPRPGERPDDVWGVQRPPALGTQPQDMPGGSSGSSGSSGPGSWSGGGSRSGHGPQAGPSSLDRGFAALRKAPLHRDTTQGVLGGVCAGIAQRTGVSVAAVRVATVALALFFGTGVGAYLLLWALLPDQTGTTHAEQGVRSGRAGSLAVLALGTLAGLGILATIFDGLGWLVPVAIAASVVYVVMRKKGRSSAHTHG